MPKLRPIRKIGNSWFIKLEVSDARDNLLELDHVFDIEGLLEKKQKIKRIKKEKSNDTHKKM